MIAEAERLARSGVREITLIGQDTTCYGEDFGLKDGLALLLEKLAAIEDLRWVRFLYAYPNKITGRLLDTIAAHEKICSYIDVPLQHASAGTLKRMKRGGGRRFSCARSRKCAASFLGLRCGRHSSSASPERPKKNSTSFANLFVKPNSTGWERSATPTRMAPPPSRSKISSRAREIERRRKHLMQIQQRISKKKKKALVGGEFDLLLEGPSEESDLLLEGRTAMHAPEIDGKVLINDAPEDLDPQPGEFYRCQITEAHDYDLVARII